MGEDRKTWQGGRAARGKRTISEERKEEEKRRRHDVICKQRYPPPRTLVRGCTGNSLTFSCKIPASCNKRLCAHHV
eukprot:6700605-Pyramimonas_sp.AAC.2